MPDYILFGGAPKKRELLDTFDPPSSPDLPPGQLQAWPPTMQKTLEWTSHYELFDTSDEELPSQSLSEGRTEDLRDRAFTGDTPDSEPEWQPRANESDAGVSRGGSFGNLPDAVQAPRDRAEAIGTVSAEAIAGTSGPSHATKRSGKRRRSSSPPASESRGLTKPRSSAAVPPPVPYASRPITQLQCNQEGSGSFVPLPFSEDLVGAEGGSSSTPASIGIKVIPPTSPLESGLAAGPSTKRTSRPDGRTVRFSQQALAEDSGPSSGDPFSGRQSRSLADHGWLRESYEASRIESADPESQGSRRASRLLGTQSQSQSQRGRSRRDPAASPSLEDSNSSSVVMNLPEWNFRAQDLTSLAKVGKLPRRTIISVLAYIIAVEPLCERMVKNTWAKKPRVVTRSTRSEEWVPEKRTAQLGSLEVLDDGGATTTVTMWDEAAETIIPHVKEGDIIYIGHLITSEWGGKPQLSSTQNTVAQLCWRFNPDEGEMSKYRPDLRGEQRAAGRKVIALRAWAERVFQSLQSTAA